jgi:hypothetical protein
MKLQVHTSRFFLPSTFTRTPETIAASPNSRSALKRFGILYEPLLAYLSSYLLKPRTPHDPELTLLTTVKQLNTVAHCSTHLQALGYRPATSLRISWHLYLVMSSKPTFLSGLLSETFFPPHLPPSLPRPNFQPASLKPFSSGRFGNASSLAQHLSKPKSSDYTISSVSANFGIAYLSLL